MTNEEARGIAARLWCLPAHSAKEMDVNFAEDIAKALVVESYSAFCEGRNGAIDNAAMTAYDMGHPDVRERINALIDDIRVPPRAGLSSSASRAAEPGAPLLGWERSRMIELAESVQRLDRHHGKFHATCTKDKSTPLPDMDFGPLPEPTGVHAEALRVLNEVGEKAGLEGCEGGDSSEPCYFPRCLADGCNGGRDEDEPEASASNRVAEREAAHCRMCDPARFPSGASAAPALPDVVPGPVATTMDPPLCPDCGHLWFFHAWRRCSCPTTIGETCGCVTRPEGAAGLTGSGEATRCEHGQGTTDYCEPCGRINGSGGK